MSQNDYWYTTYFNVTPSVLHSHMSPSEFTSVVMSSRRNWKAFEESTIDRFLELTKEGMVQRRQRTKLTFPTFHLHGVVVHACFGDLIRLLSLIYLGYHNIMCQFNNYNDNNYNANRDGWRCRNVCIYIYIYI